MEPHWLIEATTASLPANAPSADAPEPQAAMEQSVTIAATAANPRLTADVMVVDMDMMGDSSLRGRLPGRLA